MTEIINLRGVRKAKARAEKEKAAQANRVLHGTPKVLRKLADAREAQAEQRISGHKLEKDRSVDGSQSDQNKDDN